MQNKRNVWGIWLCLLCMSSATYADDNASKQIQQLNAQIQAQLQQIQETHQKENKAFNTQVQAQLKQMQTDMQTQMQKLNTQLQDQMKKLQTGLESEMQQVHKEVTQAKAQAPAKAP